MNTTIITHLTEQIPNLEAIYIFGSQADQTAHAQSDVDIAFLSDTQLDTVKIWNIANELALLLKRDVDLIDLKETNTIFRVQILSTAQRIYCHNEAKVEAFESLAYSFYVRFKEERRAIEEQIIHDKKVLPHVQ